MDAESPVLFHEEQRFRQWWVWLMLLGILAFLVAFYVPHIVQNARQGAPVGQTRQDRVGFVVAMCTFVLMGGTIWAFARMCLVTEVRADGLYIRFWPFHWSFRRIDLGDLFAVKAEEYSPLSEFGGWGLRWSFTGNGRAYSVSGNLCVRLRFVNDRYLVIGSARPEELAQAIAATRG